MTEPMGNPIPPPPRQVPPPPRQVPPPPGQVPPPPGTTLPPVADNYYQRLLALRETALRESARIQSLARGVATFIIVMTLGGGLVSMVYVPVIITGIPGLATGNPGTGLLAFMGGGMALLLFLGLLFYAIVVLVKLNGLFQANYDRTFDLLRSTDLSIMVVEDPYWAVITEQLSKSSVLSFGGKSNYKRLEDHLSFCAFHLENLVAVQRGQRDFNVWQLRWADSAFHNQRMFRQPLWVYWVGGCLSLVLKDLLWILPVLFLIWCTRFVASRGVLVAFCEYFQQEQPATPMSWYSGPR